ncbi:MAG TPA: hypothetical protein PKB07_23830, partial [Flavilitoribacter sp.]|nr:hypothetical protein [Flavilitoribacter sp.]
MKKPIFFLIGLLFLAYRGQSQSCLPEGIFFQNQTQVDEFHNNYPGCKVIEGDVYIINSQITNLDGLLGLTAINGTLYLQHLSQLGNLHGLDSLRYIGMDFWLTNVPVTDLMPLNKLTAIGGNLRIHENGQLASLNGLENLDSIGGSLQLRSNTNLGNINALTQLSVIANSIDIDENPALNSLNGLGNIQQLGQSLLIRNNAALGDLSGPANLLSIGGYLEISGNSQLTALDGLVQLDSIGENLIIENNPLLQSLNGLTSLSNLGGDLFIRLNPSLPTLNGLGNIARFPGGITIAENMLLTNLAGLETVDSLGGNFELLVNENLTSLQGLENLVFVGGDLAIVNSLGLTDLAELNHLNHIGGALFLDTDILLESLAGLENISTLGGLSMWNCNKITDFQGLGKVKTIGGDISILSNNQLQSFNGLDSLELLLGGLRFNNNPKLKDILALSNLSAIGDFLEITVSPMLGSLIGFSNLRTVGGNVFLSGNMGGLTGLNRLSTIGGSLEIGSNSQLTTLHGLDSLISVGTSLYIVNNSQLPNLDGLESLRSIGEDLQISGNYNLGNLNGLDNLATVGSKITIAGNPFLSECAISIICGFLQYRYEDILLQNNSSGPCSEPWNLWVYCPRTQVVASVQIDADGDCLPDDPPKYAAGVKVHLYSDTQSPALTATDAAGAAIFRYLNNGPFLLDLPQFPSSNWSVCQDTVSIVPGVVADTIRAEFLLKPEGSCPELSVSLGLPPFFRGCLANSTVEATTQNIGSVPAEGVLTAIVVPPVFEILDAVPPPVGQSGDSLFFDLGNLPPFSPATVRLTVKTSCDTFLLGQTLCWAAFAKMENACPVTAVGYSKIQLSIDCISDSTVRLNLKNAGNAATQAPHSFTVFRNDEAVKSENFSLSPLESKNFEMSAEGATWRMEATKYEDGTIGAVSLENCGGLTPGLVNSYWLDGGSPDYDFDCRQVVGAFDPNQKTAVPTGIGPDRLLPANRPIRYTINFQNTGTDTAFRVRLIDRLPQEMDPGTFRPIAASHPYTWRIVDGYWLDVLFDPIALPDSNINEPGSNGFFAFEIDQVADLPEGTWIENTASIIFDANPEIFTNYVYHVIGQLI